MLVCGCMRACVSVCWWLCNVSVCVCVCQSIGPSSIFYYVQPNCSKTSNSCCSQCAMELLDEPDAQALRLWNALQALGRGVRIAAEWGRHRSSEA